jgi:hypothetical protein
MALGNPELFRYEMTGPTVIGIVQHNIVTNFQRGDMGRVVFPNLRQLAKDVLYEDNFFDIYVFPNPLEVM